MNTAIPGRSNRVDPVSYDRHVYKECNAVKRFFRSLNEHRRIATCFDKTTIMFKAGFVLASIFILLKF